MTRTLALCLFMCLTSVAVSEGSYLRHTMQYSVDKSAPCWNASDTLGRLLIKDEEILPNRPKGLFFREIIYTLTEWDLMDQAKREEFLCRLNNLQYLTDLDVAFFDLGIDYQATRIIYTGLSMITKWFKWHINEGHIPRSPMKEIVRFMNHTYDFGFTEMDKSRQADIEQVITLVFDDYKNYTLPKPKPPALSTMRKCFMIVDDIFAMKAKHPDLIEVFFDTLEEYAGIDLEDYEVLRHLVCESSYSIYHKDLYGIHRILKNHNVFLHILKKGYPAVVEQVGEFLKMPLPNQASKSRANRKKNAHGKRHSHKNKEVPQDLYQMHVYMRQFVMELKAMGLFELKDDIAV